MCCSGALKTSPRSWLSKSYACLRQHQPRRGGLWWSSDHQTGIPYCRLVDKILPSGRRSSLLLIEGPTAMRRHREPLLETGYHQKGTNSALSWSNAQSDMWQRCSLRTMEHVFSYHGSYMSGDGRHICPDHLCPLFPSIPCPGVPQASFLENRTSHSFEPTPNAHGHLTFSML
ncbi:hypothetical protein BDV09DRAFT_56379 [Aspergillus tetrazonus]